MEIQCQCTLLARNRARKWTKKQTSRVEMLLRARSEQTKFILKSLDQITKSFQTGIWY